MDRRREKDTQTLAGIVSLLLALSGLAAAASTLAGLRRMVLLAVLRHAADVACAFAGKLHAPIDRRRSR